MSSLFERIVDGRTDLVFDHVGAGGDPSLRDAHGVSLLRWCAYYGDISGMRALLAAGAPLADLGENLDLNAAVFHGHANLCQFLIDNGADVNATLPTTGETPLHAVFCKTEERFEAVLAVLLAAGADPNRATIPGVETDAFMRDVRTKGETPLHRAAAYASARAIQMLLDAGAQIDARDANGDSPLSWASWHLRPRPILRVLCFGPHRVSV